MSARWTTEPGAPNARGRTIGREIQQRPLAQPTRGRSQLKQERYEAALPLRRDGWSVNDIALELGIAKSTAWLWVKHLPLDADSE